MIKFIQNLCLVYAVVAISAMITLIYLWVFGIDAINSLDRWTAYLFFTVLSSAFAVMFWEA